MIVVVNWMIVDLKREKENERERRKQGDGIAYAKTLGLNFGPRPLVCGHFLPRAVGSFTLFNGSRPGQGDSS